MDSIVPLVKFFAVSRYDALPAGVVDICKKDIVDTVAVALAGSKAAGIPEIAGLSRDWGGKQESSIIAYGTKVPAPQAAFVNGSMGHALDFDDTHDEAVLHAGVCVIPAAMAVSERIGSVSGRDFVASVACGIELMCRLGVATRLPPPQTGWVYTSTYGALGAAAACARLLGLDEARFTNALGIAYSNAAGNMQCIEDGALTKRMQPGWAARTGVESALLAQAGVTAARNIIDGKYGLFRVYHKSDYKVDRLTQGLGNTFELANLSFKPYPACRYTHPYIDAGIAMHANKELEVQKIESIEVSIGDSERFLCEPIEVKCAPRSTVDGQFSIPWTVAVALLKGNVTIGDFSLDALRDPGALDLAAKVKVVVASSQADRGIAKGTVKVRGKGFSLEKTVDFPKGHPRNPMGWEDLAAKFLDCAGRGNRALDGREARQFVSAIRDIESCENIAQLVRMIA